MFGFEYGLRRAISESVSAFVCSSILSAFVNSGLVDYSFVTVFHLFNVIQTISLAFKVKYWSTFYILGWLFGALIMSSSGLMEGWEYMFYVLLLVIVLIIRFSRK